MMHPFRLETPKHRKNRKVCKHYKSYKATLRIDFNKRCGYCNDVDTNRIRSYVIDHFVPQNPEDWTHVIAPNKYENLVYACSFCNGAKSNKWPTKRADLHNNGNEGFIKPTKKAYTSIFRRESDGSITVHNANPIGVYIRKELNLDLAIHSLNWRFERIWEQEQILKKISLKSMDESINKQLNEIRSLRLDLVDSINELYNA
jgi:5-methylcytosine-specific restriction endonuclease McrA